MLSRTLRHSRSAPSLRALSPGPQGQIAHIHSTPSANAAAKSAAQATGTASNALAKGWREKTVVELKAELKRRGLPTSGRKEELVMRLTNANANFGTAEALGATSSTTPTKALKMKRSMPSIKTSTSSAFSTPVKAPPVPKIPNMYAAPTVAPILKVNTQSLAASMTNLRIGAMQSSPMNASLLNKGSFANLRAASTLTPTKSSSPTLSPKPSRSDLRRQSVSSQGSNGSTLTRNASLSNQSRRVSTIAPASVLTANSPKKAATISSAPSSPTKPKSPIRSRQIHTSQTSNAMLSDNVSLPTLTPIPTIEIPRVPILPTTQRAPPKIEIETPIIDPVIVTAAGAHTHPAPPGGAAGTKEHLQSDSTKRSGVKATEEQSGKFEGDWEGNAETEGDTFKFEPEKGDVPAADKGILWGVVGAATLWGVFGPGRKKDRK